MLITSPLSVFPKALNRNFHTASDIKFRSVDAFRVKLSENINKLTTVSPDTIVKMFFTFEY